MIKILTSILLILFIACGQTNTNHKQNQTINEWKTLDESNYSIQYPPAWELNRSGQMGTSFVLFSPLESGNDKFKENINLIIQDLTGLSINLDKFNEISERQIKTMITNSVLIESKRIKSGNDEYHKVIYSGDQGVFHLQFEQYYWVINNKAFVLTFTSEKKKYDDFKETGEKILNSFMLKK